MKTEDQLHTVLCAMAAGLCPWAALIACNLVQSAKENVNGVSILLLMLVIAVSQILSVGKHYILILGRGIMAISVVCFSGLLLWYLMDAVTDGEFSFENDFVWSMHLFWGALAGAFAGVGAAIVSKIVSTRGTNGSPAE